MLRNDKQAVSESILGCSSSSCRCSCPIFFRINEILWITSESCCYGYGYMLSAISDRSCWSKKVGWFALLRLSCSCLWIFYLNCWVNSHNPLSSAALVVIHSKVTEKKVANHSYSWKPKWNLSTSDRLGFSKTDGPLKVTSNHPKHTLHLWSGGTDSHPSPQSLVQSTWRWAWYLCDNRSTPEGSCRYELVPHGVFTTVHTQ